MAIKEINSNKNPIIKWVKKLQIKPKYRRDEGCYVVEGYKQVDELSPDDIHTIVFSKAEDVKRFEHLKNVVKVLVDEKLFHELSTDMTPQGILAVVKMTVNDLFKTLLTEKGLYLALDGIQDPGNLGTMIRVADAAGVNGLLLSKTCVDLYNPKVIKSTMGSLKHIDIFVLDDLVDGLNYLKASHVRCYGAYLDESTFHFDMDYTGSTCFVVGNEGNGISERVIGCCDSHIKIPMPGQSESLNASIAASVLLYEAVRQRM